MNPTHKAVRASCFRFQLKRFRTFKASNFSFRSSTVDLTRVGFDDALRPFRAPSFHGGTSHTHTHTHAHRPPTVRSRHIMVLSLAMTLKMATRAFPACAWNESSSNSRVSHESAHRVEQVDHLGLAVVPRISVATPNSALLPLRLFAENGFLGQGSSCHGTWKACYAP